MFVLALFIFLFINIAMSALRDLSQAEALFPVAIELDEERLYGVLYENIGKDLGSEYPEIARSIVANYFGKEGKASGVHYHSSSPSLSLVCFEVEPQAEPSIQKLETRHFDVLELVAEGLNNIEIADRVNFTRAWVKAALSRVIYPALGVNTGTRTQAVRRAYEEGILGFRKNSKELFSAPPAISDIETERLNMLSVGMMDAAIAYQTGLSPHTVKDSNNQLVQKLKARNRANAIGIAIDFGIINIGPELKLPV